MNLLESLKENIFLIEKRIGYTFSNKEHLVLAFIHRSFVNEIKGRSVLHNERLEFLGDSVLGLVISEYLYNKLPSHPEGELSQLRSYLVDANSCASYLQNLGLIEAILLGRGERMGEGHTKISIQADAFEALVGAIYLDGGLQAVKTFIFSHFEEQIEQVIGKPPRNYKAQLQDYAQKNFQTVPVYKVIDETGPDHAKIFHVLVFVAEKQLGAGKGSSKKEAEQQAAFDALTQMGVP